MYMFSSMETTMIHTLYIMFQLRIKNNHQSIAAHVNDTSELDSECVRENIAVYRHF